MPDTVERWLLDRVPHRTEDGAKILRWLNRDENIQEAYTSDVVTMFGSTIEAALANDEDVVEAIQSGAFDDAWKDIWQLWREYGWV